MLRNSVVVVRTRPRAMPLAMITMRKSAHGFPFLSFMSRELRYNSEHWRQCLITFPNTSKFVKNTQRRISTFFFVFGNLLKHGFSLMLDILHMNGKRIVRPRIGSHICLITSMIRDQTDWTTRSPVTD